MSAFDHVSLPQSVIEWANAAVRLYFASLTRPLQAREYLSATCAKCLLLLSYPPDDEQEAGLERVRRVFWSSYILERSSQVLNGIKHLGGSLTAE